MAFNNKVDKSMTCCCTCVYWSGPREFDNLGLFAYDVTRDEGKCNQVGWKGFGGALTRALNCCADYVPMQR